MVGENPYAFMKVVSMVVLLGVSLFACQATSLGGPRPEEPVPHASGRVAVENSVLASGRYAPRSFRRVTVFRSQDSFAGFWKTMFPDQTPPAVSFSDHAVVAVFAGTFNTGGYSVHLCDASKSESEIKLKFTVTSPSSGSLVTPALTNPYMVVVLRASPRQRIDATLEGERQDERGER